MSEKKSWSGPNSKLWAVENADVLLNIHVPYTHTTSRISAGATDATTADRRAATAAVLRSSRPRSAAWSVESGEPAWDSSGPGRRGATGTTVGRRGELDYSCELVALWSSGGTTALR